MPSPSDSFLNVPLSSRTLWKMVTVVGSIVAATFWITEKIDKRVKEQTNQFKGAVKNQCAAENRAIIRQLNLIRGDIDMLFDEQIRRGKRRNPHVSDRPDTIN